jgi:outer membrane protein OmpA-like peptidoglycan-associated protein
MAGVGGSRTVRTEERANVILSALRSGSTRTAAAGYSGISMDSMTRWTRSDAVFLRACAVAEATAEVRHAANVADDAFGRPAQYDDAGRVLREEVRSNPESSKWWLERRRPNDWGRRITVDTRALIERYAVEFGLDPDDIQSEAERILADHAAQTRR